MDYPITDLYMESSIPRWLMSGSTPSTPFTKIPSMPSLSPSLWMMEHTVLGQKVVIFTDDGSNAFMITHNLAGKLMLFGTPMEQMIEVLGQEPEHRSTNLYKLDLVDRFGDVHCMQLIGIDKISTNPNPVNSAYNIFPHVER